MPAVVIKGEGTTISYSADDSSYTAIPQVQSITVGSLEVAEVETTDLDSTAKTYRASKTPDAKELSFEIFWDPDWAIHTTIRGLAVTPAATAPYWKVTFTDTTPASFKCQGFVTGFEINGMENESNLSATVKVKLTGSPTFA